jgi:hypothetical protein
MLVALRLRNSYVARSSLDFADRAALQRYHARGTRDPAAMLAATQPPLRAW